MRGTQDYILWLPSWYPNKFTPNNGDFIQRHAYATALYCNVHLIHFAAPGSACIVDKNEVVEEEKGNLKEIIVYTRFKPSEVKAFDTIHYNVEYYKSAKKFLKSYFQKYGFPKVVHVHVPVKQGNLAIWIKQKYGIDYIVSEHSSYYVKSAPNSHFKRNILYRFQVKNIFQKAKVVTNVSTAIAKVLKEHFKLNKVVTIHNTVNTELFFPSNNKSPVFTFIHVSSLSDQKNIMGILKTFKELLKYAADWRLQLIGPPNIEIKNYISSHQLLDHITIMGEVDYKRVATLMQQAHAFVLFSKHENFPCVIVEALCTGLPVVAADVAGVKEAVNETNGLLITEGNEKELLQALIKMKERYPGYDTFEIAQKAAAQYNYPAIGRQIFNLYTSLANTEG